MTSDEAKQVLAERRCLFVGAAGRIFRSRGILLPEAVEDAAQQACLKALQAIEAGVFPREPDHLFAWFTTIAHNVARDFLRRRASSRVSQQGAEDDPADLRPGPLDALIEQEDHAAATRTTSLLPVLVARLAAQEEKAVRLRLQGVPNRLIAEELGIPEGSISALFRRAYAKLRSWLERENQPRTAAPAD